MILRNPLPFDTWPNATFEDIQKMDTSPEIPAVNNRNKVVVRDIWQPPPPHEWAPPPYWRTLLEVRETRIEREVKTWFVKILFMVLILYVLAIIGIFLFKLIMVVIELK